MSSTRFLRFALWNLGVRICDVVGRPMDAVIVRVPWLNERTGACLLLHENRLLHVAFVPESWWDRFGWRQP